MKLLTQSSTKKIAPINKTFEFEQIKKAYHKMWKELKLPENLKPKLLFQENAAFKNMWFSLKDYAIYVNTKKDFLLDLRIDNKTNKNKQYLRHEIEHIRQFWEIVRFGESNEIKKNPEAKNIEHIIDSIELTLGPIKADTKEETLAKIYSKGYEMYPDFDNIDEDSIYNLFLPLLYYLNPLEIGARVASLEYRQDFIPKIKRIIFEKVKNLSREEQIYNK